MTFPEDGALDGVHDRTDLVDDHPFRARGEWWTVCDICGLARAAHTSSTSEPREADLPFRCPLCVSLGTDPCVHTEAEVALIVADIVAGRRHAHPDAA